MVGVEEEGAVEAVVEEGGELVGLVEGVLAVTVVTVVWEVAMEVAAVEEEV